MKKYILDFLQIPERERKGVLSLMVLIVLSFGLLSFRDHLLKESPIDLSQEESEILMWLASKETALSDQKPQQTAFGKKNSGKSRVKLSYFDPNLADFNQLIGLGFERRLCATILSYRKKGGVFRTKEDLRKIHGVSDSLFSVVQSYILIGSSFQQEQKSGTIQPSRQKQKLAIEVVDLNAADTSTLIDLPGIGSKLAGRIIAYRNRLGGFHDVSQLNEVYGVHPEIIQSLQKRLVLEVPLRTIDLNHCTVEDLMRHPYIKPTVARGIVNYREKHGPYSEVRQLLNTDLVNEELYLKIAPYFSVQ